MGQVGVAVISMERVGVWAQLGQSLVRAVKNPDRRRRRNPVQTRKGVMFFVPVVEGEGVVRVDDSQRNFSHDLAAAIGQCPYLSSRVPYWVGRILVQVTEQMRGGARCVVVRIGKVQIAFVRHQFTMTHARTGWNDLDWSAMLTSVIRD